MVKVTRYIRCVSPASAVKRKTSVLYARRVLIDWAPDNTIASHAPDTFPFRLAYPIFVQFPAILVFEGFNLPPLLLPQMTEGLVRWVDVICTEGRTMNHNCDRYMEWNQFKWLCKPFVCSFALRTNISQRRTENIYVI